MKRHALDIISFVFGIIFVGSAVTGMFVDDDAILEARWVWPALLVLAGAVILAFTVRRDARSEVPPPAPYDPVD